MFPNLDAELARKKLTRLWLADKLGITPTTLSLKLNGKAPLSLSECVEIKKAIGSKDSIDHLFATEAVGETEEVR